MSNDKKQVELAVVVTKSYDFALWILNKVEKAPKSFRFSLGQRMIDASLDLTLALVDAAYRKDKTTSLRLASSRTSALRYLLRFAKDVKITTLDSYAFASENLDEIGRMVGGWEKSSRNA